MIVLKSKIYNISHGKNFKVVEPVNIYGAKFGYNCFVGPFSEIQKNVSIGNNNPRNALEISKVDSGTYTVTSRIGGITPGNISAPFNSETSRNQLVFSSWRDIQQDTIGAKICGINSQVSSQTHQLFSFNKFIPTRHPNSPNTAAL